MNAGAIAAVAIGLTRDIGEGILLRPDINHFDMVNNPVAAGEQASALF
jgi:hypothetical protein